MTKDPLEAPDLPVVIEIGFEEGTPSASTTSHGSGGAARVAERHGG